MNVTMVHVLKRHLVPTLEMLEQLVEGCPDEIWFNRQSGYWKHIFHAITGIEFWFRQEGEEFHKPNLNKGVSPDLDEESTEDPTKEEMRAYVKEMIAKSNSFIEHINDENVLEPSEVYNELTKADMIVMQIRHIQHHVGYCNHILSSQHHKAVQWLD